MLNFRNGSLVCRDRVNHFIKTHDFLIAKQFNLPNLPDLANNLSIYKLAYPLKCLAHPLGDPDCPEGMVFIRGGTFTIGAKGYYAVAHLHCYGQNAEPPVLNGFPNAGILNFELLTVGGVSARNPAYNCLAIAGNGATMSKYPKRGESAGIP